MTSLKIFRYQSLTAFITILVLVFCTVNGLKCSICGQYNEGVGSITPCTNYSDQHSQLYLKDCPKKTDRYCVKYVSELSTVRDCTRECTEKEIWETQTYCCTEDGCNASSRPDVNIEIVFLLLIYHFCLKIMNVTKRRY